MWNSENWRHWRLVAKLDPDKQLNREWLKVIVELKFDALVVGGTQGITQSNTTRLIDMIRSVGYRGPLVQEITAMEVIHWDVDAYLLPVVLNAGDLRWISSLHHQAIKEYNGTIPWDRTLTEGYVICNPDSAAGALTRAIPVTIRDAVAYCDLAEQVLGLPVLYIEYSGRFGDPSLVAAVARHHQGIHLFYGGGIDTPEKACIMAGLVDTVIIGNVIYNNPGAVEGITNAVRRVR